jgi:uncharacterized protein YacL
VFYKILKFFIAFVCVCAVVYYFSGKTMHALYAGAVLSILLIVLDLLLAKSPKQTAVIDLSAVIDGRVLNMAQKQIMASNFILPRFVINKLERIAGAKGNQKDIYTKNRAKRGLNIAEKLLKMPNVKKESFISSLSDDEKIMELAKNFSAMVITADFNVGRIGLEKKVKVLNVNDLGQIFKSVLLPGETINVFVARAAKEDGQALAYIDDGTPIIIEDGKKFIGKKAEVTVKSVLQNSTSKMLFCRVK